MAEMQLQKKGKKADDGIGSVLDFLLANARLVLGVGGAAMLGIATLAVKRVRIGRAASPPDEKDPEMKAEQKSIEESWKEAVLLNVSPKLARKAKRADLSASLPPPVPSQPAPDAAIAAAQKTIPVEVKKTPICFTLQEMLLDYYRTEACVPEPQTDAVRQLVLDIRNELQDFLKAKHPEMLFSALQLGGALGDGLPLACIDHTCLLLPLILEPHLWTFVPGQTTILNDPRFWMIKRVNLEYTARGSSPWDRFMLGGYLSTQTIVESLHKVIVGSINWPSIGTVLDCTIRPLINPNDLQLEVTHHDFTLTIDILPTAETNDVLLLAYSHATAPAENLWHRSFYLQETTRLRNLDSADLGVRQQCLQILKSVCKKRPGLARLSSTHLRHVLLHVSKEPSDWAEAALSDRFLQVIESLIGYLDGGFLPCYFDEAVNVFSSLTEDDIDEMGYGLYQIFSRPESLMNK
ncbi:PREDICTED: mitochondrial dynamics protein MID49 [Nanorana parkeri]|uniref:mitochondrial dynamics protein MID49 n=1 Tax=Nanorana parkeri TaxID=125878 RepID=UPI000854F472|nr:PREDICTED: mitochondrial dynamics protein MID49 [Nanorana parkeri]